MKKQNVIITFLAVLGACVLSSAADAATYYVRPDGGTTAQCTGLVDAPYPGSGSSQPCAVNHPYWVIAPIGNNPTKLQGGDTVIIDGANNAQYKMGLGAPNLVDTSRCAASWPWDCYMSAIPSGPDPAHPTRVLGKGWDSGCTAPPQLWGTERATRVLNLQGSNNVEMQCLEVTDHSACQEFGPAGCNRSTAPYGQWASIGLMASDSSNVLLKNVNIHGMGKAGVHAGRLKDWTLENVQIVGNSFVGWDGDIGAGASSNSGTMMFNNVRIEYNGCGETYPGLQPYNCYSQGQGGYGDGIGTQQTAGNWIFNNSNVSHNVQDGIDLLYHDGNGSVVLSRTRAEGNAGNQVKASANTTITNSLIIGDCTYFNGKPFTYNSSNFDNCRALGNSVALNFRPGMSASITNTTIYGNGDNLVLTMGQGCNGNEKINSLNNIFLAGSDYNGGDLTNLYYASGYTGNGDGTCGTVKMADDYSVIYGTKTIGSDCAGKAHSKCVDPKMIEPIVKFYQGDKYNVSLQSGSPAIGSGLVISGLSSLDYNGFDRGTAAWDIGALQFGSVPTSGGVVPPVTTPPATQPPATQPPATEPPQTTPPATQPPATQPPVTQPPQTTPPATQPPATQPPATQPPATTPPATQPPSGNGKKVVKNVTFQKKTWFFFRHN